MSPCASLRSTVRRTYWRCCALAAVAVLTVAVRPSAAALPVTVETLDGKKLAGELVGLDSQSLELNTTAGREKLATSSIMSLKPGPAAVATTNPKATCRVELVDGSQIAAVAYHAKSGKAVIEPVGAPAIELPTKSIHWVRFLADDRNDKLAREWTQIAGGKAASDLLVVRKQGALDYLEGVLGDVDDEVVHFELDKEPIPVKRPKVEGLIYYHVSGDELPEPLAEAVDRGGSRFHVQSITLTGDQLTLTIAAGLKLSQPLSNLERLDFSTVNTQFLSALEPVAFQFAPYFPAKTDLPILVESNKPRRDIGFDGLALKLDGKSYSKGLSLHSRTEVSYRLPGKFRRFKTLVGIDDSVRPGGDVQLQIRGDQKLLWEGRVRGSEAARPLDLDIAGVKRIDILVDFGADLDVADVLDLCEARVTK
jgi:hypothetical protein